MAYSSKPISLTVAGDFPDYITKLQINIQKVMVFHGNQFSKIRAYDKNKGWEGTN